MQFKVNVIYFLLLFFISISSFAEVPAAHGNFPTTLMLNNQQWKLDNFQENSDVQLAEYVTGKDTVNNWSQLVTFQNFRFAIKKELTPAMFADVEMSELKKQKYTISFKKIESNSQEAFIEFSVQAPKDKQQNEIQRIVITPDHRLIVLHYVIKKLDMGEAERNNWIKALKSIDLSFLMTPAKTSG